MCGAPRRHVISFSVFSFFSALCSAFLHSDLESAFPDGVRQRDKYGFSPMALYGYLQGVRLVWGKEKAPCAVTFKVYVLCNGLLELETYITLKKKGRCWFLQMQIC